ncbi:cell wall-associated NlpC family hydrolase [Actinopolyspora biskrensis]|uniref:Cell wall-associated NlpC family hydrolase n=1 Tax=Actinopolyspora biskrensis TaxID=1470178 RepID=A0A852Z359_9ACTN|nr:C40 family peptidase [Actinopolyspora biskrensis]NYH76727.1 cell wall-associated NlpC family hydrolase [Actinopolyspora biskrensis]
MREVASHGLKRSMRGALTATAVATAVTVSSAPALADPDLPDDKSEAVEQLQKLSRQAEQLTEKYKRAKDDHEARMSELDEAKAAEAEAKKAADRARAEEEKFRGQVDELTSSVYRGSRMNQLSALMASESPDSFLDRASIMDELARDNQQAVSAVSSATEKAEAAERKAREARERAAEAEQEAARLQEEISEKKSKMEERVSEVEEHIEELSQEEQESLSGGGQTDYDYAGGSGSAAGAVQAALSKQGSPYVYGADGPSQFDCSGLMYWAYAQAGVDLPRSSSAQAQVGKPISASQLKPGDLIFYYSPVSHVSMYVGNGKAVHAPTSGQVVKVVPYDQIASVNRMRRVVG